MTGVAGEIGRIVEVHGSHVRVELDPDQRSPVHASLDGTDVPARVNSYVTCSLGAGESLLGIITDLFAREVHEPSGEPLTLEFVRPRRTATVQLLGTMITRRHGVRFDPGITSLPTLDTPVFSAPRSVLQAVLSESPLRVPPGSTASDGDTSIVLGDAPGVRGASVLASFNDLLSRPLAVVGSTGSGKSCTIARILQEAVRVPAPPLPSPRFFVLDINGEYGAALPPSEPGDDRLPNRLYINGREAALPIWLMNAAEACQWLSAAEQTQQPALVNLWALAKGAAVESDTTYADIRSALMNLTIIESTLDDPKGRKKGVACKEAWSATTAHAPWISTETETEAHAQAIERILAPANPADWDTLDRSMGADDAEFRGALSEVRSQLESRLGTVFTKVEQTADKPHYFTLATLDNPAKIEAAAELSPGDRSMRQFLQGLQLRIQNRRNDRRWHAFYNYDELDVRSARDWYRQLGIGVDSPSRACVIDCSMISHAVLPYVCGIVGRLLLELRELARPDARFVEPWVLVLEEAHNYVKPRTQEEPRGITVSRETFERIAKEGRKFGLSLIVASQRPRDVSQTILSQCANFVIHRLQNPDDIEHFRRVVPGCNPD